MTGAQQQLVAIGVKAGLARMFVTNDPEQAVAMIDELRADAQDALDSLREMTRGACPPILADEGSSRRSPSRRSARRCRSRSRPTTSAG